MHPGIQTPGCIVLYAARFYAYLTGKEEVIIRLIYETGYSAAEISRALNVSRQSVNQCKKRAEKKLLKYYS